MKLTYNDLATIIEGMYYGGVDEPIESIEDLIEYLNDNRDSSVVIMSNGNNEQRRPK